MSKSVSFKLCVLFLCVLVGGCMTVRIPEYIKADHPYSRKIYGDYGKIMAAVRNVIVHSGWKVQSEGDPTVYERAQEGSAAQDVLIFTNVKQHSMLLYSSYTHLNVYVHAIAEGAQVEVRFQKVTPLLFKQFYRTRNDKLAERLLRDIEQAVLESN
jgi:hypothetical protein